MILIRMDGPLAGGYTSERVVAAFSNRTVPGSDYTVRFEIDTHTVGNAAHFQVRGPREELGRALCIEHGRGHLDVSVLDDIEARLRSVTIGYGIEVIYTEWRTK